MNIENPNWVKHVKKLCKKYNMAAHPKSEDILPQILNSNHNSVIFDIGGFDGCSVKKYQKQFPNSIIYSFEPSPINYLKLKKMESEKVKTFNLGLSSKKGKETFFTNQLSATNSLLPFCKGVKNKWGGLEGLTTIDSIQCEFITLDEFIEENQIYIIDFLKIDVQGAEFKVLEGAKNTLNKKKIAVIQMELIIEETYVGQKSSNYYFKLFESYGYIPYIVCDFGATKTELLQMDVFFILAPHLINKFLLEKKRNLKNFKDCFK